MVNYLNTLLTNFNLSFFCVKWVDFYVIVLINELSSTLFSLELLLLSMTASYNVICVVSVKCDGFRCNMFLSIFTSTFSYISRNCYSNSLAVLTIWVYSLISVHQTGFSEINRIWHEMVIRNDVREGEDLSWPNFVMTMHETGSSLMGLLSLYAFKIRSLIKLSYVV